MIPELRKSFQVTTGRTGREIAEEALLEPEAAPGAAAAENLPPAAGVCFIQQRRFDARIFSSGSLLVFFSPFLFWREGEGGAGTGV